MALDINTAIMLARRYLAPTVVVILVFGGGLIFLLGEYRDIAKERKALFEERLQAEKMRSEAAIALVTQKAELDKRELMLKQLADQNNAELKSAQKQADENVVAASIIQKTQITLNQNQRLREIEEQLQAQMSQFSALGVDLDDDKVRCSGPEGLAKYNTAKAKFKEIYTLAEAHGLTKRYKSFFFRSGFISGFGCANEMVK